MTTLTDALILRDCCVFFRVQPPDPRPEKQARVAADPTVTPEAAGRQERGDAGECEEE
ncbi:hypothetical protein GCM10009730_58190 [Streptomyces albidochromogenes]